MNPVLLLAALLPAIILLIRVYKLDKIEKEPRPLLMADKKRGIALVDPGEVYLPPDMFPAKEDDNGNSEN